MRMRVLRIGIMALLASLVVSSFWGADSSALGNPPYAMPETSAATTTRLNEICAKGFPVAHAAYPSGITLNESTGTVSYKLNIKYKRCSSSKSTAFYAVTGYPRTSSDGTLTICPNVGTYGAASTYDCVKYISNPWTGEVEDSWHIARTNSNFYGLGVGVKAVQPSTSVVTTTRNLTGSISNWSTRTKTSGTATLGASGALCAFYNDGSEHHGAMCQSVYVKVSWTRYNLVPSITSPSDGTSIESNYGDQTVKGQVTNTTSTTSKANTAWQMTQITYNPGVAPTHKTGGTAATDPCGYFTGGADCKILGSGTATYTASGASYSRDTTLGGLSIGTRVCFALSVKPYNHSTSNWRHSALVCYIIAKKPKVHILGGDLLVRGTGSNVTTSVTDTKRIETVEIDAPQSSFSGLWKTGVDGSGKKLAGNSFDEHWIVDRVYRPGGGDTCQWAATGPSGSPALIKIPTTSSSTPIKARTVFESGAWAGVYMASDPALTGNLINPAVAGLNGNYVWNRVSGSASWISINAYGQNYSKVGCYDPTFYESTNIDKANVYVFKLKNGFTINNPDIKLETARVHIEGAVDNTIKFFVNGHDLGPWQNPGWSPTSTATSNAAGPGIFKQGNNSLEIHVQSTYSHTGILIDKFTIEAKATKRLTNGSIFGSWGEYGVVAPGAVTGMASGAGYSGGTEQGSLCKLSLLSFANVGPSDSACIDTKVGKYILPPLARTVASRFPVSGATTLPSTSVDISTLTSGKVYTRASGTLTLTQSADMPAKKWVVINAPNSDVVISKNLKYTANTLSSAGDIPQLVIIARNIIISDEVSQVDAWLIATGTGTDGRLNTCGAGNISQTALPNGKQCTAVLQVNGPVVANHLLLRRTVGAENGVKAGDPAEVFNLRPDAYLWASTVSGATKARTITTTELPPRF